MEDKNRIEFVGLKSTSALQRFVQRQIEKWIQRAQTLAIQASDSNYAVTIERGELYPYYQCDLRLRIGGRSWFSIESGRTLQESVLRALRHLTKDTNTWNENRVA